LTGYGTDDGIAGANRMTDTESLRDLLTSQRARSETVYQAVRHYLAERLDFPEPADLLSQLDDVVGDASETARALSKDAPLLEDAALLVLSSVWDEPGERERVRRAVRGATHKLPVTDPEVIAVVCLYGLHLVSRAATRREETMTRRPDGSLVERRIVEIGPLATLLERFGRRGAAPATEPGAPADGTRTVVLLDIQSSASAGNAFQQGDRAAWLLDRVREAASAMRLAWSELDPEDRGDGVRLLIPEASATLDEIVNGLPGRLAGQLRQHASRPGPYPLKVRMVVHSGLLRWYREGWRGDPLVHAARLIDADAAKAALRRADEAGLALILSERVFADVVRAGHGWLPESAFQQIPVEVKETRATAWVHLL
jgi:hypothetical protein